MSPAAVELDVEVGEVGKLFRPISDGDVERDAARREAVLPEFAYRTKIGRAEKGDPVVPAPVKRAVARFLHAEAGETGALRQIASGRIGRHIEVGLLVNDLARHVALDDMHSDRLLEKQTEMEERHRIRARPVGEQREVVAVADLAPFLVIDFLQDVWRRTRRSNVGTVRPITGLRLEEVVGERNGRVELQAVGLGGESLRERIQRRRGCGRAFQQCAAVYAFGHKNLSDRAPCLRDSPRSGKPSRAAALAHKRANVR